MTAWLQAVICRWCKKKRRPAEYGWFMYRHKRRKRPYCNICIRAKKHEAWASLPPEEKLAKHRRDANMAKAKKYKEILNDHRTNRT